MQKITNSITVYSDNGEEGVSNQLTLKLIDNNPSCPITFFDDKGTAVFSLAEYELEDFVKILEEFRL